MNNNFTYEQLIAQKLEQLEVPDMADAIWNRIKTDLDNDMPEDDNNGNNDPSPAAPKSPLSFTKSFGWLAFAICIVVMISINKQTKKENTQTPLIVPAKEQHLLPLNNAAKEVTPIITKEKPDKQSTTIPDKNEAPAFRPVEPITVNTASAKDSSQNMQGIKFPSGLNYTPLIKDTGPPKRKGVKGITDDDYRIVPKPKDTMP